MAVVYSTSFAQVAINTTDADTDASTGLDVNFPDKGLLIPRVALTQTTSSLPITSPATSLLVYNTEFFQVVHQERQILQRHG